MRMTSCLTFSPRVLLLLLATAMLVACGDDSSGDATGNNAVNNDAPNNDVNNDVNNDQPNNDQPNNDVNNDVNNDAPNNDVNNDPDPLPPLTCERTTQVDGVVGETTSLTFDTTMTPERPRDLGPSCGNTASELRWAPQEVIEFHAPAEGTFTVTIDTVFPETDSDFNTVIQVRRTCETVPNRAFPPSCFDNAEEGEFRSRGAFSMQGGEVAFIFVTGFSKPPAEQGTRDKGTVRVDLSVTTNTAPTLAEASLILIGDDSIVRLVGSDAEGDFIGALTSYYINDELIDIYGDGVADEGDVFPIQMQDPNGESEYDSSLTIQGSQIGLAGFLRSVGATHVEMQAFDQGFALSEPLRVPILDSENVGLGEACDGMLTICSTGLVCEEAVCVPDPAIQAFCDEGTALELPEITNETVVITTQGTIPTGAGRFSPVDGCVNPPAATEGGEVLLNLTIPEGVTVDLEATTDLDGTGTSDTFVYLRSLCVDGGSELACNDDIGGGSLRSQIAAQDLSAGTYTLFVEQYGGVMPGTERPFELQLTLRPVLEPGATCDPEGMLNRCSGDPCAEGLCP